jgi:hypothetical protein
MSLLADKLAEAHAAARGVMIGDVIVCRSCGCTDNDACIDRLGRPCSWVLLDIDRPNGICSACAERAGWHRFFFSAGDLFADEEDDAA